MQPHFQNFLRMPNIYAIVTLSSPMAPAPKKRLRRLRSAVVDGAFLRV